MITAPYVPSKFYDDFLPSVVAGIRRSLSTDDDAIVVSFGSAGTGKTTLMMHAYSLFTPSPLVTQIALSRHDLAGAMHAVKNLPKDRFVGYDEANVSRRETMTQWNRDLIDLYSTIRGKNVFHWWNNPSVEYLDRSFIEERAKIFIFCFSKGKAIRKYRLFTKDGMLRMLDKEGDLKTYTVRKKGEKYAYYEGWFRKYDGPLWGAYLSHKEERMDEKIDDFHRKYGLGDVYSLHSAALRLGINDHTLKKAVLYAQQHDLLAKDLDYSMKGPRWLLTASGLQKIEPIVWEKPYSRRITGTRRENTTTGGPNIISRDAKSAARASSRPERGNKTLGGRS